MIKAGIIGASGYTGIELLRLLLQHPQAEVVAVSARTFNGKRVGAVFPALAQHCQLVFCTADDDKFKQCDVVFFATPHGVAMQSAAAFINQGIKVIDLGADFRIRDKKQWEQAYSMAHTQPQLLSQAVYGLTELNRDAIKKSNLIANPGCYPTAVQLALKPLLENNLIDPNNIIADCKSGLSGAGRNAATALLLCEASESFKAYSVKSHRHFYEMKQQLEIMANGTVGLTFVPHLVPMIRGIFATIYVDLLDSTTDVQAIFAKEYADERFVTLLESGVYPQTRHVKNSNFCQISLQKMPHSNKLVILSTIDNLVKGASGQAVQNMNAIFALEENLGLAQSAAIP